MWTKSWNTTPILWNRTSPAPISPLSVAISFQSLQMPFSLWYPRFNTPHTFNIELVLQQILHSTILFTSCFDSLTTCLCFHHQLGHLHKITNLFNLFYFSFLQPTETTAALLTPTDSSLSPAILPTSHFLLSSTPLIPPKKWKTKKSLGCFFLASVIYFNHLIYPASKSTRNR